VIFALSIQVELNPNGKQKKKAATKLREQTPELKRCLSYFQFNPFIIEIVDVFVNNLLSLLESSGGNITRRLFFEMAK
jgi:hypothetical protein